MRTQVPSPDASSPRGALRSLSLAEHAQLEERFRAVLDEAVVGAKGELGARWTELANALTEHMALEEREILPAFAEGAPDEAAALRCEHDELRRELDELGVCVDLHLLSPAVAGAFIARLRAHALREDAALYRFAAARPQLLRSAHG